MGVAKRKYRPKPRPKPKIDYPPVPRRKWIPPDQRPKPPKPEPKYIKPDGLTQKLAVSSLKRVWNQYDVIDNAAVLTGNFSQCHRRFSFKSNGLQGACNSAVACVYSKLYNMEAWTKRLLDQIIITGDGLYLKSTQEGDRCTIDIPPEKVYKSFFLGNKKITLFVSALSKVTENLTASTEDTAKNIILGVVEDFLKDNTSGIFSMGNKHTALWTDGKAFHFFDPEEYDSRGNVWKGVPGEGACLLVRFKSIKKLVEFLYRCYAENASITSRFQLIPCGISRMVTVDITPPDTFQSVKSKQDVELSKSEEQLPPPKDYKLEALVQYVGEDKVTADVREMRVHEISPDVTETFSLSKRPSWLRDGPINKQDVCRYPMPIPAFLKKESTKLSYYTEIPHLGGILRGSTYQTDPKFTKYAGRQSMGNALSALLMLRLCKSKFWLPNTIDAVLQYGDILYRNAMLTIPRSQTLRLSNFPKRVEFHGRYFTPVIEECVTVGQLQSQEYDVLDLERGLEEFFVDNDCCIVLGPQTLAVWIEDGVYYMFDPDERDQFGKAIDREQTGGVACVRRSKHLKDLVDIYMHNTDKSRREERFYICRVRIDDYRALSGWNNFEGVGITKWILRGSFHQGSFRFSSHSRNTQGTANALIGLAMQKMVGFEMWTSAVIDEVLIVGDEYYKASVETLQAGGVFRLPMLMLSELNRSYKVREKEVYFEVEDCVVNGLVYADESDDLLNLRKGLEYYFRDFDCGVLTARSVSLAIWKYDNAYFYLDPYSRDHEGIAAGYGTSCVIRSTDLEDFTHFVEHNLEPGTEDLYNISCVRLMFDAGGATSLAKQTLNNYTRLKDNVAILQSWTSENADKYGARIGKQSVPMCLVAIGFNRLKPSKQWTKYDLDLILDRGDALYIETMEKIQYNEVEDLEAGGDASQSEAAMRLTNETLEIEIFSDNVHKEFDIGPNRFTVTLEDAAEGNIRKELKTALKAFFSGNGRDALLEANGYAVALWRDAGIYYVFDPKPRNKNGQAIGKEDWDDEPEELDKDTVQETEEELELDPAETDIENTEETTYEAAEEEEETVLERDSPEEQEDADEAMEVIEEEKLDEEPPKQPRKIKKGQSFWSEQEKLGRACTLWFADLDDFVDHVYENIPTNDRTTKNFRLKSINAQNNLQLRSKRDPEDERNDLYSGDWYDFREIEHGRWILRGTLDLTHEVFPGANRGKQTLTTSLVALAMAHIYEMTCFVAPTPDTILAYGDKLYTYMKRARKKQLLEDGGNRLSEDEVDWLLQHEEFSISDIPNKICISKFMVHVEIEPAVVSGDVKAQDFEEVYDVKRGLQKFFERNRYGILTSKDLNVAVWRGEEMYYMFDGLKRGPSGLESAMGTACITRYLSLEKLASVFLNNLPRFGKNQFFLHKLKLSRDLCPRNREPKNASPTLKIVPKLATLKMVGHGKSIVRGSISQEDPKFGKGPNVMSASVAVAALTTAMIHKADTWSRPIIDDIIVLGAELHDDSVERLGYDFNPWEDHLEVSKINPDYKLGVLTASFEIRDTVQRGVLQTKGRTKKNLRRGIEDFFEENAYGILITKSLTLALWEESGDDGSRLIYMFDPNPRSATGMPVFNGTACLLIFVNANIAADHIIGCILDPNERSGEYEILPVEIVVENIKSFPKGEKPITKSGPNALPRCSKAVVSEQKKLLRKLAEEERKRREAKRIHQIGRTGYYPTRGGEAILRGYLSQNHEKYAKESRNNQDIPNCIVSVVMNSLIPVNEWTSKHIDLILDTGEQLYIDSYIAYGPRDKKLGMENVLRKFYMGNLEVHVTIYKPVITEVMTASKLLSILEGYFQQESFCILSYRDQYVSLFSKSGYFYLFDPHERNIQGNLVVGGDTGTAVVVRFDCVDSTASKVIRNLSSANEEYADFSLWLTSVKIKTR
ncbi:uncharacterized protein LOC132706789 [Cylas formicarius]|uniref:uncharacterized protein LOC132706789 n=1 Tax=Cylas formicarius TaxID=197179 RepID=UPI00295874D1|nr:uncharacterized protein LOC132706789 [Cylas formicarius]